ncbi:hypothetical protein [Micromonospora sp. DT233]|uniref:hypothetical protein n=1 Tax=Micromonospora sp. DT233 TaxID=3393432 RepID=UPI003CED0B69
MSVTYAAILPVREATAFLSGLLRAERQRLGTRISQLASDNTISRSTGYAYPPEGLTVLAAQAPGLHSVLLAAKMAGYAHTNFDGTLISNGTHGPDSESDGQARRVIRFAPPSGHRGGFRPACSANFRLRSNKLQLTAVDRFDTLAMSPFPIGKPVKGVAENDIRKPTGVLPRVTNPAQALASDLLMGRSGRHHNQPAATGCNRLHSRQPQSGRLQNARVDSPHPHDNHDCH